MSEPVLKVLSGRLAGTAKPLPAAGTVSVGHQYWQDVVIRDERTRGIAVDLTLAEGGQARLSVLSGEATLLGQTVAAGTTAILPPFVPFAIGGVSLAWGDPDSPRWAEAGDLMAPVPVEPEGPPDARAQAAAVLTEVKGRAGALAGKRATRVSAFVIAGLVLLAVGAAAFFPVVDALGLRPDAPQRVARALEAAGIRGLSVARQPSGDGVAVTGVVASEGQRVRTQEVLRDQDVDGTVDVQTSGELAQAAADVARGRGLRASARAVTRTAVELRTSTLAEDARAGLVQAVRTDVRQISSLTIRDDLPGPDDVPVKALSDLTRKVSTLVAGDPGYIQTVDGARYFPGAVMPSGHRLVGIEGNNVYIEKNGRRIRVAF